MSDYTFEKALKGKAKAKPVKKKKKAKPSDA